MTRCFGTVHFGNTRSGANHNVTESCFADIAGSVVGGKSRDEFLRKFVFAVHQNVFPWDEYIVKNNECFLAAILRVAFVDVTHLERPGITGLSPVNIGEARCGGWNHANDRVVLIGLSHIHGGHDADPV